MPKSFKGNTELLIWTDLFTGLVIAKAGSTRRAQQVDCSYEECVFRRFGADEVIRHDWEPGFMAEVFRSLNQMLGQKQSATMAYQPQANGKAERIVQTLTRAIKMYVADSAQQDWDEYAERLVFGLNSSFDRIRGDTPFYLAYGWDPRTTIESVIPVGCIRGCEARRWLMGLQRHYQYAREQVNERLRRAIQERADWNNDQADSHNIEPGSWVWLYLDRVKEGYARKLAHLWHGPFRVSELIGDHAARLITGTDYGVFSIIHLSKLKLVREYPDRPRTRLSLDDQPKFDFDEALLPEDSWERVLDQNEFEGEKDFEHSIGLKDPIRSNTS